MKKIEQSNCLRFFTTTFLTLSILASSSMFVLALPGTGSLSAEIAVSGRGERGEDPSVKLDGERALSGRTFFASGVIETSETSSANINMGKLGRIDLSPNSVLSLSFSEGKISGKLSAGSAKIFNAKGVSVRIETPYDVLTNREQMAASFTVNVQSGTTQASSETGTVYTSDGQPAGQAQTTASSGGLLLPLSIFAGLVAAAVISVVINRNDDDEGIPGFVVSPVR